MNTGPFSIDHQRKRLVRATYSAARVSSGNRQAAFDARPATKIVLAIAIVTGDANRLTRAVDDDDCVEAIGLARAAVIFNGVTRSEGTIHDRYCALDPSSAAVAIGRDCQQFHRNCKSGRAVG